MKKLYFICLILAALFIAGCGNSDGWGEPSDTDSDPPLSELLEGKYFVSQLQLNSGDAAAARIEMDFTENRVTIGSQSYGYVLSGRSLTISELGDGIVHKGGKLFSIVDTTNPEIAIYVGIKQGTGLSNDTLSGNYVVSEFGDEARTVSPDLTNYTVETNGALAVSSNSQERGILDASGDFFTVVDTGLDIIKVGMKESSSRTTAQLKGKYLVNVIGESNAVSSDFFTAQFEMDLDGAGEGTITVVKSSISISGSRAFTYSVESDGSLKYETKTVGIVSPDAQSFTMAIDLEEIIQNSPYSGTGFAFGIAK